MAKGALAAELDGAGFIEGIDLETLRESFNRIVRVAVELLGGAGGEVAIRGSGQVWRSSGRTEQHTPLASLVEVSPDVLWLDDWSNDPRIDASLAAEDVRDFPLYVGAPIRLPGGALLGVLSVVGATACPRDEAKAARLMDLAGLIADQVERHRAVLAKAAAEAEAAAARATAAALVEGAPFAVSMVDREMRILQVSQRWREARGLVDADLIGRRIDEMFQDAGWADVFVRAIAGETVRREVQVTLPSGRKPWLRSEHTPWRQPNGAIGGVLTMSIEISDLVDALQSAEQSEQRLKLAMEIGELRMWETDLLRKTVTAAGANDYEPSRDLGFHDLTDTVWQGVHPHDRPQAEALWRGHVKAGSPFRAEFRLLRQDAPHLWVQVASEAIRDDQGQVVRIVNVMRNIDKAKRAELNLQRARDAAEAANRAKSEFLANMSHEIRTPLNGVMGVASALGRTELTAPQSEMVELITSSAETLESLLSDVLDLARIESGRLELKAEPFELAQSVRDVAALFEPSAHAKGLDLIVETPPGGSGLLVGDAPRIRQVLSNLVSNAVKFTAAGSVRIRLEAEPIGDEQAAVTLSVADTGIGFDSDAGERLFARFEQADGSITRRYGGTGLGLAISRSLAEAMGGRLGAISRPDHGSTFSFVVTLARSSAAAAGSGRPDDVTPAADLDRLHVLLAEDHPTNRRVVELILEAAGVALTCVENGAEAVQAAAAGGFDLILMDMQMPVMDGLTATRAIRELESAQGLPRTPIVSLTANAMPEHARASAQSGADGHLTKPISAEALLHAVAEAASGRLDEEAERRKA